MTTVVTFIDTSILCNILPVPGFAQDADFVRGRLRERIAAREVFILPMTTVIETGNHIAQVPNGDLRRKTAQKFSEMLELVITQRAPWRLNQIEWGEEFLSTLKSGCSTGASLVDHATAGVGAGDLCILTERDIYKQRSELHSVQIWTLDAGLSAYNQPKKS